MTIREMRKALGLSQSEYTADELMEPMREYAAEKEIAEPEPCFFIKDGEHAYGMMGYITPKIVRHNYEILDCLDEWTLDVDGDRSDGLAVSRRYRDEWRLEGRLNEKTKTVDF